MMKGLKILIVSIVVVFIVSVKAGAQPSYGTTGLLNMPTADMDDQGTMKAGVNFLERHTSVARWFYDTYNYYFNVTLFPWFEITYNMILHKSVPNDRGITNFWVPDTYGKFVNQDRQFGVRFKVLTEDKLSGWMPQVVFGWDDVSSNSWGDISRRFEIADNAANNFSFRMYLVASKHFKIGDNGRLGTHLAYVFNNRSDYPLNAPSFGVDYRFSMPSGTMLSSIVNGLDLMLETYPAAGTGYSWTDNGQYVGAINRGLHLGIYDVNLGFMYYLWQDRIALYGELYGCKDFSGGIQLRVNLL